MATKPLTFPAAEPVSLSEAKAHLRIDHADEDTYIGSLISAARAYFETQCQKAFATQSYLLTLDSFPSSDDVRLDRGPVLEITALKYDDSDGIEQTLDPNDYVLDNANEPGWLIPIDSGWPATMSATGAVRVEYIAGWEAGTLPADVKAGMLLLVGHWYNNREAVADQGLSEPPHSVNRIIHNHRVFI